jgi:hypothetical protein
MIGVHARRRGRGNWRERVREWERVKWQGCGIWLLRRVGLTFDQVYADTVKGQATAATAAYNGEPLTSACGVSIHCFFFRGANEN